jgi:hypothetical protein
MGHQMDACRKKPIQIRILNFSHPSIDFVFLLIDFIPAINANKFYMFSQAIPYYYARMKVYIYCPHGIALGACFLTITRGPGGFKKIWNSVSG